jgi:signal transduction histidine kinase
VATITDINAQRLYEASELRHSLEREASARKRAEEAEQQRQEADDRRRGQGTVGPLLPWSYHLTSFGLELLIDVTSHELRQPVSAILNCSALVRANMASLRDELWNCSSKGASYAPPAHLFETMDEDLDALDSIYQCGLAQGQQSGYDSLGKRLQARTAQNGSPTTFCPCRGYSCRF